MFAFALMVCLVGISYSFPADLTRGLSDNPTNDAGGISLDVPTNMVNAADFLAHLDNPNLLEAIEAIQRLSRLEEEQTRRNSRRRF